MHFVLGGGVVSSARYFSFGSSARNSLVGGSARCSLFKRGVRNCLREG